MKQERMFFVLVEGRTKLQKRGEGDNLLKHMKKEQCFYIYSTICIFIHFSNSKKIENF